MSESKNHRREFEKYVRGEMTSQEAHAFEHEALDDPFTQEALAGFERHGKEGLDDLALLRSKVVRKKRNSLLWLKYATAAMLVLTVSLAIYLLTTQSDEKQELAISEDYQAEEQIPTELQHDEESIPKSDIQLDKEETNIEADRDEEVLVMAETREDEQEEAFYAGSTTTEVDVELEETTPQVVTANQELPVLEAEKGGLKLAHADIPVEIALLKEEVSDFDQNSTASIISADAGDEAENARAEKFTGAVARSRSSQPDGSVSGTVTDDTGTPLPGVNIVIKGTVTGTQTDLDGNYRLPSASGSTLIISYVGFEVVEIETGSRSTIDVTLSGSTELQEVVVAGVGTGQNQNTYLSASPNGGMKEYKKYLRNNLRYPNVDKEGEIEGTVVLQVTISPDGSITNIEVKRSLSASYDEEAVRLVRNGPDWAPAWKNGVRVEDQVKVKVKFKLD